MSLNPKAGPRFLTALFGADYASLSPEVLRTYPSTTNERGEQLITTLIKHFTGPLGGKRILDIGSGFGGTCIAAAKHGANVLSVELSSKQLALARLNLEDNGDLPVQLIEADVLELSFVRRMGKFDVIICDNVIEHVEDARRLIWNIAQVLTDDRIAYVTAPNRFASSMVLSDCHYRIFGITLLDRADAQSFFNHAGNKGEYEVGDYFSYGEYERMASDVGLFLRQLVPLQKSEYCARGIASQMQQIRTRITTSPAVAPIERKLIERVDLYLHRFDRRMGEAECSGFSPSAVYTLFWDYDLALWYFVLSKRSWKFRAS